MDYFSSLEFRRLIALICPCEYLKYIHSVTHTTSGPPVVILLTCKKLMIARAVKFSWINTFLAQIIIVFLLKLKSRRLLSWSLIKEPRKDFCQENANEFEIRHSFWRFESRKKSSGGNKGTTELLWYLLIINKLTMNLIDRV